MKQFGRTIIERLMSLFIVAMLVATSIASTANARFISPDDWDPIKPGVGTNRYAYSENDPINKSDPNGHFQVSFGVSGEFTAGLGIAGGLSFGVSAPDPWHPDDVADATVDGSIAGTAGLAIGASTQTSVGPGATEEDTRQALSGSIDVTTSIGVGVTSVAMTAPVERNQNKKGPLFTVDPKKTKTTVGIVGVDVGPDSIRGRVQAKVGYSAGIQASGHFSVRGLINHLFGLTDEKETTHPRNLNENQVDGAATQKGISNADDSTSPN